jgi:hypothetical protein
MSAMARLPAKEGGVSHTKMEVDEPVTHACHFSPGYVQVVMLRMSPRYRL